MVELLLQCGDIDPNLLDRNGLTPLGCVAMEGHERVVKLLLERDNVDPNRLGKDGDGQCSQRARPFVGRPIGHRLG